MIILNNNNNLVLILRFSSTIPLKALRIITLALAPAATGAETFQGINSCQVPIYYTWVERDNHG